jgi:hypothetical protein
MSPPKVFRHIVTVVCGPLNVGVESVIKRRARRKAAEYEEKSDRVART